MARFFFNILDDRTPVDEDGTELPDISTARSEAVRLCGEILREAGACFGSGTQWELEVTDDHRIRLLTFRFSIHAVSNTPSV